MSLAKCGTIMSLMETIAPKRLAEDWDNVGLIIGDGGKTVSRIMVCLDMPDWVLEEALEENVDMIITHHPLIFSGIKNINTDSNLGRKIIKLIKNEISLYSSHTNYDIAKGGLNDIFAMQLGFDNLKVIHPLNIEKLYKVIVYVPKGSEDKILESFSRTGAGFIGKYSSCSFRVKGIGTFKPEEGSHPYIGNKGILEEVDEYRLETIVPEESLTKTIKAMIESHPYEEVAYDIYELINKGNVYGIGRLGVLQEEMSLASYAEFVKKTLNLSSIRYAGPPDLKIKKVALINGSGSKYIKQVKSAGADVLITGDMQYHQTLDALESGLSIIDAGHFGTEIAMVKSVAEYLKSFSYKQGYDIEILESKTNIDPIVQI